VRYVESRWETMVAMQHGRAQVQEVELGARSDGTLVGIRVRVVADAGAYPGDAVIMPFLTGQMASGVYRMPRVDFGFRCVVTNTTPIGAYRGAGRPEATALVERAMDQLAAKLEMDPAELRRRNFIAPDDFPHQTVAGATYDSGEYAQALERVLQAAGYDDLRADQARRRERGDVRQLGIGLCTYVELTGLGVEMGACAVGEDGTVTVKTGTSPQGQGHETSWAQLISWTLGVPTGDVRVVHSDTARVPRGMGTMGSRTLQVGGTAMVNATREVLAKGRELAAHLLEASVEDIAVVAGQGLGVVGAPSATVSWAELAKAAADPARLPEGMEPGLEAEADFETPDSSYPFGAHVAVVEVDVETGLTKLVRHVTVDDSGKILNPLLAEGQIHGGIAQGVAQALYEGMDYDEDGNCLTGSLVSYALPTASELPLFETARTETPSPLNPLGAKGIGESGAIGATPAVWNAVVDALSHLGVDNIDMPATPMRVWEAIRAADDAAVR
jgi:carbon-monoxide dehydrogenase large subunit